MKLIRFFIPLSLVLACCSPMDTMETIEYKVLREETLDQTAAPQFDQALEVLGDLFYLLVGNDMVFRAAAISYPTVDPQGKPIWASGVVYHPISKKSKGVIDFLPIAHTDKYSGCSDLFYVIEGILAFFSYTIILPDLVGTGVSNDQPIPFLMAENTGRVAYDMRRAAAQYLWDEFRYKMPQETTVMGYSLGGFSAMAVHRYYETYHSNTVKVKEAHACGGPFDVPAAFAAIAQKGYARYPIIPSVIVSYNHYYDLNLDFTQIFKGELLANYPDWTSGEYNSGQLDGRVGPDVHAYMHEDFFKPLEEQNSEFKKLQPYLVANALADGWIPKAPIYMTHCTTDTYVPIESAEEAVRKLRNAGANVSFLTYPGDHLTVGYHFFLRAIISMM